MEIAESNEEVPPVLSLPELLAVVKILSAEKQEERDSQQDWVEKLELLTERWNLEKSQEQETNLWNNIKDIAG